MFRLMVISLLFIGFSNHNPVYGQNYNPLTEAEIDALVEKTLIAFDVPGISVAIIKDDQVIHAKGYGIRDINTKEPVTADTLFQIASNTKAMTTAALAILMDEGTLTWDDKVTKYLPEFRMYEPYVTREFTIRDLLTHRSGLPLGAGDLLFFPDSVGTLEDVFKAISVIKPETGFRSHYDYDNLLYTLAGEIVSRVSGMSWADFVETRIFKPLGLDSCKSLHLRVPSDANQATPHAMSEGMLKMAAYSDGESLGAAGGVNCSAAGLTKWLSTQLNHGKMPNGKQLFSAERHAEMWTPVTLIKTGLNKEIGSPVTMSHYALGWEITRIMGHQIISHTGALDGMVSLTVMVPENNLGIVVLANRLNGLVFTAIRNGLLQGFLDQKAPRSFGELVGLSVHASSNALEVMQAAWDGRDKELKTSLSLSDYAQIYSDAWYGDIEVVQTDKGLRFISHKSPSLKGSIKHFEGDTFVVEWDDPISSADAYMTFILADNGKIDRIVMKKFDPRTDFSFDFWHLDLRPKK